MHDDVELERGLNPLADKTDGITPDAQRPEVAEPEDLLINSDVSSLAPENSVGTNAVDPSITPVDPGAGSSPTVYSTVLNTEYDGTKYTSSVSYRLSSSWFFADNNEYNQDLAITSSLLSSIAYDKNYLSNTVSNPNNSTDAVENWFLYHGFSDVECYDLDYDQYTNPTGETDQHVSEMFVAYKTISDGATTKKLIAIAIRGTNGTLDEWQSNFDLGGASTPQSEWTNPNNHMGFDITANRLDDKLDEYMETYDLTKNNSVLWITGHSRGGALANLIASKRCVTGHTVFAYTFASPATTTSTTADSSSYSCIFNIINTDDLVTMLPMENWDFVRYGVDKDEISIENNGLADDWDDLVSGSVNYTSSKTNVDTLVSTLSDIAIARNDCYTYRSDDEAYYYMSYDSLETLEVQWALQVSMYPSNVNNLYRTDPSNTVSIPVMYGYKIYQKPAFFMQLLAAKMGQELSDADFLLIGVALYLHDAKKQLISLSHAGEINHPHYPESYYLLAMNITN